MRYFRKFFMGSKLKRESWKNESNRYRIISKSLGYGNFKVHSFLS